MSWDYSALSHLAKQNGGPANLLAKHGAYYFKKGAASKNPVIVVSSLISLCVGIGGTAIYQNWKKKKVKNTITEGEIKEIEDELIAGMEQAEQEDVMHESTQEDSIIQPPEDDNGDENLDVSN